MKTITMVFLSAVVIALVLPVTPAFAATPGFGNLYYNGTIVRTVVPPAAFPNEGRDNFYKVTNGAAGQLGIAAVAPGSADYHGGAWKVFIVTFISEVTPTLLTSEQAVLSAQGEGMLTVTRNSAADLRCPIQPKLLEGRFHHFSCPFFFPMRAQDFSTPRGSHPLQRVRYPVAHETLGVVRNPWG